MKFVALIGHGPNWKAGRSVYEQGPVITEHLVAMCGLYDRGALELGGPFERDGGIAVLDVDDEETAHAMMQADPGVLSGVMVYELHRLTAYFDAHHEVRTTASVSHLAAQR